MKNLSDWIVKKLKGIFWYSNINFSNKKSKPSGLLAFFHVRFDETAIFIEVTPREREPWDARIEWERIIRVCYSTGDDFLERDEIYIFTGERPESHRIPMEAVGAPLLWNELIRRELFPAKLAIEAASTLGKLFCHPAEDSQTSKANN